MLCDHVYIHRNMNLRLITQKTLLYIHSDGSEVKIIPLHLFFCILKHINDFFHIACPGIFMHLIEAINPIHVIVKQCNVCIYDNYVWLSYLMFRQISQLLL